jgi:tetratricopeptide (TPR) repeat protein
MRKLGMTVMAIVILAIVGRAHARTWWDTGWSSRREVTLAYYQPSELPGDDVVVVTMPTTSDVQIDGEDIRVVTGDGEVQTHRVLQVGPGDQVTVAFTPDDRAQKHYIYWGNPEADAPETELEVQRGVLQETWAYPGGAFSTFTEAQAVVAAATDRLGCGFRPSVFQGFNPFGPEQSTVSVFTGHFDVPAEGEYTFAISSQNGSFLTIDGELLLSNGGRHSPQRDASIQDTITLAEGLHEFEFTHVSPNGDPTVVLAWQPPNGQRIWPMAATDFAPVIRGRPGSMELRDMDVTIDFEIDHAGEAFASDRYFQRYEFDATTDGFAGSDLQWEWDFGDGITASGENVSHVYLADGEYTVQLTAQTRLGPQSREYHIVVARPWEYVTRQDIDSGRDYSSSVASYNLTALSPDSLAGAILLFDDTGQDAHTTQAGRAFLSRDTLPATMTLEAMGVLTRRARDDGNSQTAIDNLSDAAEKVDSPTVAGELYLQATELTLVDIGDADAAEVLLDSASQTVTPDKTPSGRTLSRLRGDVYRLRGDITQARTHYELAEPERQRLAGQRAMLAGDFARHVESYLKTKELELAQDQLDAWAEELPDCKLNGYWSLLQVQLYVLQGENGLAAGEVEVLVGVNPESSYGAELLMLAANAHSRLDDRAQVIDALERIIELYPESDYASRAKELLAQ